MSYILGVSAFYHDSSAALLKNGNIVGAVQEERFSRIKHDASFPKKSIEYLLNANQISINDLDAIVFYEKPFLKFERLLETYIAFAPRGFKSFLASMPIWINEKLFQKNKIYKELKNIDRSFKSINKIKFSEHHLSHAASAFYPSTFEESLILTIDGVGEWATTSVYLGKNNKISKIKEILFPHSLGLLYSAFTYYLGFKVNSGEYKVMGLAPYGEPKFKDLILKNLVDVKEDGSFKINMKYFSFATNLKMINSNFEKLFNQKSRTPETEEISQFHMDVASSVQAVTEDIILKICHSLKKEFNINNLCLAGGVALNSVANGKICKKKIFENIWIQPASGDAGCSLGAALAYWHIELNNKKIETKVDKMNGSLLGPEYSNLEIKNTLDRVKATYKEFTDKNLIDEAVRQIINQKAIGFFQGKMEFGPRALGNRSILADPRSDEMQKKLNLKVKFRESFRPFAPAIIKEHCSEYFDLNCTSPYMLLVSKIKDEKRKPIKEYQKKLFGIDKLNISRSTVPAVTHVDYSCRIQTVSEINKRFYKLLKKFYELTNCPLLVNTSFNVRGEPIVCTPEDAFNCFMGTNLDILVIGNYILYKEEQNSLLRKNYLKKYNLD